MPILDRAKEMLRASPRPVEVPSPQYRAVVKFSVLDPDWAGWRATNSGVFNSLDEYREHLWGANRMKTRMRIFGQWAVPHYQAMAAKHDFRVLVQHSPDLPDTYLGQLRELADANPVLRLAPTPNFVEAHQGIRDEMRVDGQTGPVVMLRVDDDDIMSADFLDQLDPHVTPEHRGWAISLGYGLAARTDSKGLIDFRLMTSPLIAIGQAYVGWYDRPSGDLDISPLLHHRLVHRKLPTILDSRSLAWIYVKHPWQDTRVGMDPEAARARMIKEHRKLPLYKESWNALNLSFPHLGRHIERAQQT